MFFMDTDAIQSFLAGRFPSYELLLDAYVATIAKDLMFCDVPTIQRVTRRMRTQVTGYASRRAPIYGNDAGSRIYTRQDFIGKDAQWLCPNIDTGRRVCQHTSGSTTGAPFYYCSDQKYFDFLTQRSEFGLILEEYGLSNKPLTILNLFRHEYNPKPETFAEARRNFSDKIFHTYGAADATTYFVNWNDYATRPAYWHATLLDFLNAHFFDIVLIPGPVLNMLVRAIKSTNFTHQFAYLLSHTTEFPRTDDFAFLKANGNIAHYCDHMRCWDGGASFFTCRHGTYHLHDNVAWVEQGPNNELISTCYFNLVSPFVKYWSGDLCEIQDDYQLCACGRHYRPFKMLQNRPFALKGPLQLSEIRRQVKALPFCSKINQVQFENMFVNIYTDVALADDEKKALEAILQAYTVRYL